MKTKQIVFFLSVSLLFTLTGYSEPDLSAASGSGAQWNRAAALRSQGELPAARKAFEAFLKQWPKSRQAPAAQQAIGDIYFEQGKDRRAFEAYEELIRDYYTGLTHYDSVLENQYTIAQREMTRKRMKFIRGGYTSPERAIPYLESILKNAPQWERAPEMQFQIGEAYRQNEKYEDAILAYTTAEYRYVDSPVAEQAAFAKVQCLQELVNSTPYSEELRERARMGAAIFAGTYPESEHLKSVTQVSGGLAELAAKHDFDIAEFYVRVPDNKDAARIYYEKVIRNHEGTRYASLSAKRLRELFETDPEAMGEISALVEGESVTTNRPDRGPLPERLSEDVSATEVAADRMEYEGSVLIGEGNVAVQQEGATLQSDRITVNPETGEMAASGNVLLLQEQTVLQADQMMMNQKTGDVTASGNVVMQNEGNFWKGELLVYNVKTQVGDFGESDIFFDPAYIVAEQTERISTNEFMMYNARITTCPGEDPLVYAIAKEVHVIDEDKPSGLFIKAKSVTFYVADVPVFYLPHWHRHMGYRVFTYAIGQSGKLGMFLKIRAELHPKPGYISNTHLDYYSDRGIGLGQDLKWRLNEKPTEAEIAKAEAEAKGEEFDEEAYYKEEDPEYGTFGDIKTYFINDNSPFESADTPAEQAQVDSARYRISVEHKDEINESTYFMGRLNYLSDPFVMEDFFREEFRRYANPENYAVLQYSTNHYAASVRIDQRLNDFYTTINRKPAVDYDRYLARIGESRYFLESENSFGFYEKEHSDFDQRLDSRSTESNAPPRVVPSDYSSFRLDTYNPVYMPLRYNDYLNIIPRVAYRGTWYNDTKSGSGNLRNIFEFGTLTSFKAYKTLTQEEGFYGQGLHSVVEPYADYLYRFDPSLDPDDLYWFDDIDQLDARNDVRFGVRNFIQTRRGEKRIANFFESDVFTTLRLDPLEGEDTLGLLEAEATLRLTDHFYLDADLEFDWEDSELDTFNFRGSYRATNQNFYALSYRFRNGQYTLVTPHVRLHPSEDWFVDLYAQYDFELGQFRDRRLLINRKFDCITAGLGARIDDDEETSFIIQFWLTGFPGSALGPSY